MTKLKIGFIMDPPEMISFLEDTSFSIMKEACRRAHEVFYIDSRHLYARKNVLFAKAARGDANDWDGFREEAYFPCLEMASLDRVFLRKDPPFNAHYLSLTYLLELLGGKVPVINDPAGVRNANEKLFSLRFPDLIPETFVASEAQSVLNFLEEVKEAVLKPLWGRGGEGIVKVGMKDRDKEAVVAKAVAQNGTVVVQRFLPEVLETGDKRILLLNGGPLGAYRRLPPRGDFRVNLYRDGRYEPAGLDARDEELIRAIAGALTEEGLYFAGLDVIGGLITEINVTSPGGVPEIDHFAGKKLEAPIVDFLESFREGPANGRS